MMITFLLGLLALVVGICSFVGFVMGFDQFHARFLASRLTNVPSEVKQAMERYWSSLHVSLGADLAREIGRVMQWSTSYLQAQQNGAFAFLVISVFLTRLSFYPHGIYHNWGAFLGNSFAFHTGRGIAVFLFFLALSTAELIFLLRGLLNGRTLAKARWLGYALTLFVFGDRLGAFVVVQLGEPDIKHFLVLLLMALPTLASLVITYCTYSALTPLMQRRWPRTGVIILAVLFYPAAMLIKAAIEGLWGHLLIGCESCFPGITRQLLLDILWFVGLYLVNYIFDLLSVRQTLAYLKNQTPHLSPRWWHIVGLLLVLTLCAACVLLGALVLHPLHAPDPTRLWPWFYLPFAITTLVPILLVLAYLLLRSVSLFILKRFSRMNANLVGSSKEVQADVIYLTYMNIVVLVAIVASFGIAWATFNGLRA